MAEKEQARIEALKEFERDRQMVDDIVNNVRMEDQRQMQMNH